MSASAPGPRWPLFERPRILAGPLRVMMQFSYRLYSLVRPASVERSRTAGCTRLSISSRNVRSINSWMISGYARNDPPFGWSVLMTTRHGSLASRYHSNPIAHCRECTRLVFLYSMGVMPQPDSISVSDENHLPPKELLR